MKNRNLSFRLSLLKTWAKFFKMRTMRRKDMVKKSKTRLLPLMASSRAKETSYRL
jgi:hypothetical protein